MKKLKLTQLSKVELEKKELNSIKGGYSIGVGGMTMCTCGCLYSGNGGSSTHDNGVANCMLGYH